MVFTGGRIVRKYNTGNYESVDIELSYSLSGDKLSKAAEVAAEAICLQHSTFLKKESELQKGVDEGEPDQAEEPADETPEKEKTRSSRSSRRSAKQSEKEETTKKEKKARSSRKKKSRVKKDAPNVYPSEEEVGDFQNEFAAHWESLQDAEELKQMDDDEFDEAVSKEFKALTDGLDINKIGELEKKEFDDMVQAIEVFMKNPEYSDDDEDFEDEE